MLTQVNHRQVAISIASLTKRSWWSTNTRQSCRNFDIYSICVYATESAKYVECVAVKPDEDAHFVLLELGCLQVRSVVCLWPPMNTY